jgi:transcription elongation factor Elf1
MAYVRKTCPTCGREFLVLKKAEKKAMYCTLACLTIAQNKLESRDVAFPGLG